MTVGRLSIALLWAGTLAAQTFIQMSDPQFGMFTKNASFEHETVNLEFGIANANRLRLIEGGPDEGGWRGIGEEGATDVR